MAPVLRQVCDQMTRPQVGDLDGSLCFYRWYVQQLRLGTGRGPGRPKLSCPKRTPPRRVHQHPGPDPPIPNDQTSVIIDTTKGGHLCLDISKPANEDLAQRPIVEGSEGIGRPERDRRSAALTAIPGRICSNASRASGCSRTASMVPHADVSPALTGSLDPLAERDPNPGADPPPARRNWIPTTTAS